jgi:hypothetical protein
MTAESYECIQTDTGSIITAFPDFWPLYNVVYMGQGYHGRIVTTYENAQAIIRSRKVKQFAIHAQHQAPARQPELDGKAFRVYGSVWVTRKVAGDFLRDSYRTFADRALVEMSLHRETIFIG